MSFYCSVFDLFNLKVVQYCFALLYVIAFIVGLDEWITMLLFRGRKPFSRKLLSPTVK